jgi:hypothetical protein
LCNGLIVRKRVYPVLEGCIVSGRSHYKPSVFLGTAWEPQIIALARIHPTETTTTARASQSIIMFEAIKKLTSK